MKVVNNKIQSTVDAKALSEMDFGSAIVEGPISLDILMLPDLNSANPLYKSLTMFASAKVSSVVAGFGFPAVLTSRSDSTQVKIDSLRLALDIN